MATSLLLHRFLVGNLEYGLPVESMGTLGGTWIQEAAETSWLQMVDTLPRQPQKLVGESQYWKVPHIQVEHADPYSMHHGSIMESKSARPTVELIFHNMYEQEYVLMQLFVCLDMYTDITKYIMRSDCKI